uniref:Uncharacterized protein n=1 Tax=Glossina palpalis gambiensis TaxID=67801 RepID=A0A1B0C429_9MUSC
MTDDLTTVPCVGRLDVVSKYLISPDVFMDEDDTSSTKYEDQWVEPEADSVVSDVETLRDIERKLSPLDKIVQLHFDEFFTNNQVLYSRANDAIIGYNYVDERKKNTYACKTVLVFAVRSLATPFKFRFKSTTTAKDVGFDVRALVCDRNTAYKEPVQSLPAGVVLIYGYLHLLKRYKAIIEKTKEKCNVSIIANLYK